MEIRERKIIGLVVIGLLLFAAHLVGQPAAWQLPVAWPNYADGSARAIRERKPLVVFLGSATPRQVPGTLTCHALTLAGVTGPAVVVALPDTGDWLVWAKTMPDNATDAEIRRVARLEVGRTPVVSFPVASDPACSS